MTQSDPRTDVTDTSGARTERVERIEEKAEALKKHDRAIPLDDGEEDEGVGDVTQLVP